MHKYTYTQSNKNPPNVTNETLNIIYLQSLVLTLCSSSVHFKSCDSDTQDALQAGTLPRSSMTTPYFTSAAPAAWAAVHQSEGRAPLGGTMIDGGNTSEETEARPARLSIR